MRYSNSYGMSGLGATEDKYMKKLKVLFQYCHQTHPCGEGKCSRLYTDKDWLDVDPARPGDMRCGCGGCDGIRVFNRKKLTMTSKNSSMFRM